jgi:hypothetical protein
MTAAMSTALRGRLLVVLAAAAAGCGAPPAGWNVVGPAATDDDTAGLDTVAWSDGRVPLSAITGLAASPHGLVVGGVSAEADRFWDAWVVPYDTTESPRRLAPVGLTLLSVAASGALWATSASMDPSAGTPEHEVRLSPSDGSPSVLLSPELPSAFSAERAVADGAGGWLLVGSQALADGATHASVFAVDAQGTARRVASDPTPDAPLVSSLTLAPDALYLTVYYSSDGLPMTVMTPRWPG